MKSPTTLLIQVVVFVSFSCGTNDYHSKFTFDSIDDKFDELRLRERGSESCAAVSNLERVVFVH